MNENTNHPHQSNQDRSSKNESPEISGTKSGQNQKEGQTQTSGSTNTPGMSSTSGATSTTHAGREGKLGTSDQTGHSGLTSQAGRSGQTDQSAQTDQSSQAHTGQQHQPDPQPMSSNNQEDYVRKASNSDQGDDRFRDPQITPEKAGTTTQSGSGVGSDQVAANSQDIENAEQKIYRSSDKGGQRFKANSIEEEIRKEYKLSDRRE